MDRSVTIVWIPLLEWEVKIPALSQNTRQGRGTLDRVLNTERVCQPRTPLHSPYAFAAFFFSRAA
jgi:hypothetical protein